MRCCLACLRMSPGTVRRMSSLPVRHPSRTSDLDTGPARQALWSLTSADVLSIGCPTCGVRRYAPCLTLQNRVTTVVHRGRTSRYLSIRFGVGVAEPRGRAVEVRRVPAATGGLRAVRLPHAQPWRLPLGELSDLINFSFFDLARVVTAHACGLDRMGLDDLLFGPDRILQSIDALNYAVHDRQIRRELRILTVGDDEEAAVLAEQQQLIQRRLVEARRVVKERRVAGLTAAGVLPLSRPGDDPRQVARAWLGRYLREEKEDLVRDIATRAGVPPAACTHIRSIREKITKGLDIGWLTAPVNDAVRHLIDLGDCAFRQRIVADAGRQNGRDDALCHPLVLNRWRDQLHVLITEMAPEARNGTLTRLGNVTTGQEQYRAAQLEQFHDRRRLLAALLQRREECTMLITDLNDTLTVAERRDPSYAQLKQAADQAYDELVRRHPVLYQHFRAALAPFETRYGRLVLHGSRSDLRSRIFADLDRAHGRTMPDGNEQGSRKGPTPPSVGDRLSPGR